MCGFIEIDSTRVYYLDFASYIPSTEKFHTVTRSEKVEMSVSPEDFVSFLSLLASEKDIRVMVHHDAKGGILTGTSATVGGICGGPMGVVIGGLFGGTVAAITCKSTQEDVATILTHLKKEQRVNLFKAFADILCELNPKSYTELCSAVERNPDMKQMIVRKLKIYIRQAWKVEIIDSRTQHGIYE